jgi:hydrogenase expression/formation protein HypE
VLEAMGEAAAAAAVELVTGDTKVVERGSADGMFINTAGIGEMLFETPPGPAAMRPGDVLLLGGDIGRHGATIMAARQDLGLASPALASDCAPLHAQLTALAEAGIELHAARDLTRGGLASALIELCADAGLSATLLETTIAIEEDVRAVCELLGLDPLYLANEGRMLWVVSPVQADAALAALTSAGASAHACGTLEAGGAGRVTLATRYGTRRALDLLSGDQLPRIC